MKLQNPLYGALSAAKYFPCAIVLLGILSGATFAASPRRGVDNRLLEAEQILSGLGYWVLTVDGKADASTRHAITAFQKVERLKRTGSLTVECWKLFDLRPGQPHGSIPAMRISKLTSHGKCFF